MGRIKTPFINKEKAVTYKLIPTESSCSVTCETESKDTSVLVKSKDKTDASKINDFQEGSNNKSCKILTAEKRFELRELGFIDDGYDYTQHLRTMHQSAEDSRNSIASFVHGTSVSASELSLERQKKVAIGDLDDIMAKMNEVEVSEETCNIKNDIGDDFFIEAMKEADQVVQENSKMEPSQKTREEKEGGKVPNIIRDTPSSKLSSNFEHVFALYSTKNSLLHKMPHLHTDDKLSSVLRKKIDILEIEEEEKPKYEIIENLRLDYPAYPAKDVELVRRSEQRMQKCYKVNNKLNSTSEKHKVTDGIGLTNIPEVLLDGYDISKKKKVSKFEYKELHHDATSSPGSGSEVQAIDELQNEIWRTDIARKGETREEKKLRKLRVKAGRKDARAAKKELKHAFKNAKI
jgi:hypothetical protein